MKKKFHKIFQIHNILMKLQIIVMIMFIYHTLKIKHHILMVNQQKKITMTMLIIHMVNYKNVY